MNAPSETVFITGGGSGIGAGLARAFHARGAEVIIAGRDERKLDAVAKTCAGMHVMRLDVADPEDVANAARQLHDRFGSLSTLVNNAGIQQLLDFRQDPISPEVIRREIDINLTGLLQVSSAMLPLLRARQGGRLVQVSSGLAFVPLVAAPVYSASKAAIHSLCMSLREQLRGVVQVVELIPPVVETNLHDGQPRRPPSAMKLEAFVSAAMNGLDSGADEIPVGLARVLRTGSRIAPGRLLKIVNRPTKPAQ